MGCSICDDGDFTSNGLFVAIADKELFICELCRATKHKRMRELDLKRFILLQKPPGY